MKGARRFKDRLKTELKNPEFRREFDEEEIFAAVAIKLAEMRQKHGITQKEMARRMKTTQQTVSRLEDRSNKSYSLKTLIRAAFVLRKRIEIKFV